MNCGLCCALAAVPPLRFTWSGVTWKDMHAATATAWLSVRAMEAW